MMLMLNMMLNELKYRLIVVTSGKKWLVVMMMLNHKPRKINDELIIILLND